MCGICGFYGIQDDELLKRMCNSLSHRGPDDEGYFREGNFSLGHKRLSIIDLSEKGRQPIHNENKNFWLGFNGEVYNYINLREKLKKLGHKFYSNADSEVVIHLYEQYGENFVNYINGMFAFAIYDSKKKKLILGRDRLGIKPLYYTLNKDLFLFASEIKSLLQYDKLPKEIGHDGLNNILSFRYNGGKNTIIKSIKKLEPGHILIFENKRIKIKKYWDINFSIENKPVEYYANLLKNSLEDSIKLRLRSDVPLGALLSGGIDSSTIVALMSKYTEPKTFTIGFEGEPDNEFEYARLIADKFNTKHKEILIKQEKFNILPKIIYYMDEPAAGTTSIAQYCIFEEAKKHVKVVLSGQGADELFAGYEQIKIIKLSKLYNKIVPKFIQKNLFHNLIRFLPKDTAFEALTKYLNQIQNTSKSYMELTAIFSKLEKQLLFNPTLNKKMENNFSHLNLIKKYFDNSLHYLDKVLLTELKLWIPEDILLRADRMAMANSIEGRVPFMDHNVVSLAAKIPNNLKLRGFRNEKFILKKSMEDILPKQIIKRKKQRFNTPIDHWFKDHNDEIKTIILDSKIVNDSFNKKYINNLFNFDKTYSYKLILKRHKLLRQYYARQIWLLLTLVMWHKIYIEGINYKKILK